MCLFQLSRAKIRAHERVKPVTLLQSFSVTVEATFPPTVVAVVFSTLNYLEANGADMLLLELLRTDNDIKVIHVPGLGIQTFLL